MAKNKMNWKRTVALALLGYVVLVGIIFVMQREFIYIPYQVFPEPALIGVGDMQVIEVTTIDQVTLKALYRAPSQPSMPVIILFHGNGGSIANRGFRAREFIDHGGYGFLLAEYRGYASNPGKPTEQGLYNDARAYMKFLTVDQGLSQNRIVLYGESLGTGVATQMALEFADVRALVLESPFTSMKAMAQKQMFWLPAYWLVRDHYNNIDKIKDVKAPLLVLHGVKDGLVPFAQGVKVFQNAQTNKRLETFSEGGHVDLYDHGAGARVRHFLAAHPTD